jgi:hypothetical protein
MATDRPLESLTGDILSFTGLATELFTQELVKGLQQKGPYWDGDFEAAWEVQLGDTPIPEDRAKAGNPGGGADASARPANFTQVPIPYQPQVPIGYTVGNRMEYTAIATDLEPDTTGRYRKERPGRTADPDWFDNLINTNGGGYLEEAANFAFSKAAGVAGLT